MLKPKVCRPRTSNLVGGWSMRYQLPWPAIKACEVGITVPVSYTHLTLPTIYSV